MKNHFLTLLLFIGVSLQAQSEKDLIQTSSTNPQEEKQSDLPVLERFSLNQNTISDYNSSFGYNMYFRNYVDYKYDDFHFQIGAGLATQKSFRNNLEPDIQVGIDAFFEYYLNSTFSLYAFGRYFSRSINGNSMNSYSLDPFFLNTELGAGIKGNFNKFQIDVGTRTALDKTLNQTGPQTRFNTSFSLEF
ncbi:hypothetical protein [Autumnicola musiva]|uniref:Outer membrane protein beta-barrel domain-containing protein n=1 Tax=Autumnicola musiva TaxID=3075589 RepID=A0ABU3D4M9_9FLAO|nr:hypothetical protein [Zunongwangia sp. F117]MDT0675993.1 hypothetical protein [Zunongwangia sp. F117]